MLARVDETPAPEPQAAPDGSGRRRQFVVAGVLATIAVLVLGGVLLALRDDDNDDVTSAQTGTSQSSTSTTSRSGQTTKPTSRSATTVLTLPDGSPAPTRPDGSPAPTLPDGSPAPTIDAGGTTVGPTLVAPGQTLPPVTAPPSVRQAYIAAYDAKCASIWSIAGPDGLLWDVDDDSADPFRVQDCRNLKDPDEADLYDTIEDARSAGADDAVFNLQGELAGFELRNTDGSKIWDE